MKDFFKQLITAVEEYSQRLSNPCWQQETVYFIGKPVIDLLDRGIITEEEIPLYAFGSQYVWKNVCDETPVDEIIVFENFDSDNE